MGLTTHTPLTLPAASPDGWVSAILSVLPPDTSTNVINIIKHIGLGFETPRIMESRQFSFIFYKNVWKAGLD